MFADFEQRTLILISTDFRSYILMKAVTAPHYSTSSGSFRPKTISARASSRSAQIKFLMGLRQTAFSGNNFDFGASIEIKRTVSEYHNLNYCRRVVSLSNKMPSCITNKSTVREYKNKKNACDYHNQKY